MTIMTEDMTSDGYAGMMETSTMNWQTRLSIALWMHCVVRCKDDYDRSGVFLPYYYPSDI